MLSHYILLLFDFTMQLSIKSSTKNGALILVVILKMSSFIPPYLIVNMNIEVHRCSSLWHWLSSRRLTVFHSIAVQMILAVQVVNAELPAVSYMPCLYVRVCACLMTKV